MMNERKQIAINLAGGVCCTLKARDYKNGIVNILGKPNGGGKSHFPSTAFLIVNPLSFVNEKDT